MDFIAEHISELTPSLPLSITSQAKKMRAEGQDICSFGAGEPNLDTPDFIKEAAIEAIQQGKTKYSASDGIIELREAIQEKLLLENGYDGYLAAEWEKKWHPTIEEPELAIPQHAEVIRGWLVELGNELGSSDLGAGIGD